MKSSARLFFLVVLLIPMIRGTDRASAAQCQTYVGDGITNASSVVPSDGCVNTGATATSCLVCHGPSASPYFKGPDMTSYLKTGHKNVIRSVQFPPVSLTGPDGLAYSSDLSNDVFHWANNSISVAGIAGDRNLYFILGGWIGQPALPQAFYDGGYVQGTQQPTIAYSCGRCHTTGFTMDTSVEYSANRRPRSPEFLFPGITWTPYNSTGLINFDPDGDGPAVASSWALEGIQCERCHDASTHYTTGPTVARGANATVLCLNCHRQEHTLPYAGGGLGSNIRPTPYTDNGPIAPSEPLYPLPSIEVGSDAGYALQFYGYSTGMEFLNGVHAKFTGNFQQIGDPSRYESLFVTEDSSGQGAGCTTCHDVHQSTVKAVGATAPFKQQCPDCHGVKAQYLLSRILHPSGTGTPLGNGTDIAGACVTCHMPHPNQGKGAPMHVFRINASVNYSTFPTQDQWNNGSRTANTSSDGTYAGAVWADVDLACGQCHGGSAGPTAVKNNAPYLQKSDLANYATGIHNDKPSARFSYSLAYPNTLQVNVDGSNSVCLSGTPCDQYSWDWGDGSSTTNYRVTTASHTYAAAGSYSVTLVVTDYGTSNSAASSVNVAVYEPDYPPTVAGCSTMQFNAGNWTATLIDASTDDHGIRTVTVSWGDGLNSSGSQGGTFTHTYLNKPSSAYTVTHTAYDTSGQTAVETCTIPASSFSSFSISGAVQTSVATGSNPISSAMVKAQNTATLGTTTAYTNTSGTFSIGNLKPGTYNITVTKSGYNFGTPPQATVTVGPNQNITIHAN